MSQSGGSITKDHILDKILSIGFEIESSDISPCRINNGELEFHGMTFKIDPNKMRSTDSTMAGDRVPFSELEATAIDHPVTFIMASNRARCHCCSNESLNAISKPQKTDTIYKLDRTKIRGREAQNIYHTEFKITYPRPKRSNNILLSYFRQTIYFVRNYYGGAEIVPLETLPKNAQGTGKYLYLCKIMTSKGSDYAMAISHSRHFNIARHIPWHIQCTIGIKLEDLDKVVQYIADRSGYDYPNIKTLTETFMSDTASKPVTRLEWNMGFLLLMYNNSITKKLQKDIGEKDFKLAIRHPYDEIYQYHLKRGDLGKNKKLYSGNYIQFPEVTTFPYNGTILLEIRDFYDQILRFAYQKREEDQPLGLPLDQLEYAIQVIESQA